MISYIRHFMANKQLMFAFGIILVLIAAFLGLNSTSASGYECRPNNIILCGTANYGEVTSAYNANARGEKAVYNYFGINPNVGGLVEGYVSKADNGVYLNNNTKVASNAITAGNESIGDSTPVTHQGKKFFTRPPSTSFASSRLSAFIKLDANGRFMWAVLKSCGNPVSGTPTATPPKVEVSKSSNAGATVAVGNNITYTITTKNTGGSTARDVITFDVIPADSTFVAFNPGGAEGYTHYDATTGQIVQPSNMPHTEFDPKESYVKVKNITLEPGESQSFTLTVKLTHDASNNGTVCNRATIYGQPVGGYVNSNTVCSNIVKPPEATCDSLTITAKPEVNQFNYSYYAKATGKNGTTIKGFRYVTRDANGAVLQDRTQPHTPSANAEQYVTFTFPRAGNYTVELFAIDSTNRQITSSNCKKSVTIQQTPVQTATCDVLTKELIAPLTYKFTARATATNGATISAFKFTDGRGNNRTVNFSPTANATAVYTPPAFPANGQGYTVIASAVTTLGEKTNDNCQVRIKHDVVVTPTAECTRLDIATVDRTKFDFVARATATGGANITGFIFNDGRGQSETVAIHPTANAVVNYTPARYPADGKSYTMTATAITSLGNKTSNDCKKTFTTAVAVTTCDSLTKQSIGVNKYRFTALASARNGATISAFVFDYGHGEKQTATLSTPATSAFATAEYQYPATPKTYTVQVTVITSLGNITSDACKVTVTIDEEITPTADCVSLTVIKNPDVKNSYKLIAKAAVDDGATVSEYAFDFGDGSTPVKVETTDLEAMTGYHTYQPGTYTVKAQVKTSVGVKTGNCVATLTIDKDGTPQLQIEKKVTTNVNATGANGYNAAFELVEVAEGATVRFIVKFTNTGSITLTNVAVRDYLPSELTYVDSGDTLETIIASIAPGESLYFEIDAIANSSSVGKTVTNYVCVFDDLEDGEIRDTSRETCKKVCTDSDGNQVADLQDCDDAQVKVTGNGLPPILPKTGAAGMISALTGFSFIGASLRGIVTSRRGLKASLLG